MKKLKLDQSAQAIQVMRVENRELVANGETSQVIDPDHDHIVEFTAHEDSAWIYGDTAPTSLETGFPLHEGTKVPYLVKAGEEISVFGKITIAW